MDRFVSRRRAEYLGPVHDADGRLVLVGGSEAATKCAPLKRRASASHAECNRLGTPRRRARCSSDTSALDHLSPNLAPLAARVLHQRRAHLQSAATVALPIVSLVCIRVRRFGRRLFSFFRIRQKKGNARDSDPRRRWRPSLCASLAVPLLIDAVISAGHLRLLP